MRRASSNLATIDLKGTYKRRSGLGRGTPPSRVARGFAHICRISRCGIEEVACNERVLTNQFSDSIGRDTSLSSATCEYVPNMPFTSNLSARGKGPKPTVSSYSSSCRLQLRRIRAAAVAGPKPKKSYGQNFLVNEEICCAISRQAKLTPGDFVLEIGPGTGNLTRQLLRMGAQVLAIEADKDLVGLLSENFKEEISVGSLTVAHGNALKLDLDSLIRQNRTSCTRSKIVANLPFHITTEILKILLPLGDLLEEVLVMLQVEAAERLTNQSPGSKDYRAMSVLVDYYSHSRLGMVIDRTAFQPQPHVDCAMVHFGLQESQERSPVPSEQAFWRLVNICFSSRRKTLRNNLKAMYSLDVIDRALASLNLSEQIRPQELRAVEYAQLSRVLADC